VICANGAAAHHFQPGDQAIVMAFQYLEDAAAEVVEPSIVFVDEDNRITGTGRTIRPGTFAEQAVHPIQ
jgi:aspartate 1-decarboxylase